MTRLSLALLLSMGAAHAAAAGTPRKPKLNGWLALYDLANRKGILYTVTDPPFRRISEGNCDIHVPASAPGMPSGDTCEIRCDVCPHCESIPGFDPAAFAMDYDDKGCKGTLGNLRFVPDAVNLGGYGDRRGIDTGSPERDTSPAAFRRYMRGFLTKPVFDYLGLLYLQDFRKVLRSE